MCLSAAGRIVRHDGGEALIDVDGVRRRISLAPIVLDGGRVDVGDWVLVHTGLAVRRIDAQSAAELRELSHRVRRPAEEDQL